MQSPRPPEPGTPSDERAQRSSRRWDRGLWLRVATAVILAPPVLLAVYGGPPWTDLLLLIMAAIMAWEWGRLCGGQFGAGAAALLLCAPLVLLLDILAGATAAAGGLALALLFTALLARRGGGPTPGWSLLGLVYVVVPLLLLRWLRGDDGEGRDLLLWLLLVVWACDIGAYAVGRSLGGPKLLPRLSPRKTWAGLGGGMTAAAAVGASLAGWTGLAPLLAGLLGAALAVVAHAGDFFESGVKRRFGAKDASGLMPGHGGLLDRVDGLVAAAVPMAVLMLMGAFVR